MYNRLPSLIHDTIAMESVDHQPLSFFKELTSVFTSLMGVKAKDFETHEGVGDLIKVIKHYTNMNVKVVVDAFGPAINVPMVDKNNVLVEQWLRDYVSSADGIRMINNAEKLKAKGRVDLTTGKVHGCWLDLTPELILPPDMVDKSFGILPEEMAAMVLHELGHVFVYYEYMGRSVTTNQALAGMAKALDGTADAKQREAVLVSVKQALGLKDLDEKELSVVTDSKVTEMVVITSVVAKSRSELGSNVYDAVTWEYMADQFAARFGAARHLVTALDKLYKMSGHKSYRGQASYLFVEGLKLLMVALPFKALWVLSALLMVADVEDDIYDEPEVRFSRIRSQILDRMKNKNIGKNDVLRLQQDLATIDEVMESVKDRRQFISVLLDTVIPAYRRTRSQKVLQGELEKLAFNDLFAKAAVLRTQA